MLEDLCELIESSIQDDPPIAIQEGGIIKEGYNQEVDRLRNAKSEGKTWLRSWRPAREKKRELRISR